MNSKLLFQVVKRIKSVSGIKIYVIFSVATLDLAVVPRRVWLDQLVPYPTLFEARLEQCGGWIIALAASLREFTAIIRLHTFHLERKSFKHMLEKNCRAVYTVFLESLYITEYRNPPITVYWQNLFPPLLLR